MNRGVLGGIRKQIFPPYPSNEGGIMGISIVIPITPLNTDHRPIHHRQLPPPL